MKLLVPSKLLQIPFAFLLLFLAIFPAHARLLSAESRGDKYHLSMIISIYERTKPSPPSPPSPSPSGHHSTATSPPLQTITSSNMKAPQKSPPPPPYPSPSRHHSTATSPPVKTITSSNMKVNPKSPPPYPIPYPQIHQSTATSPPVQAKTSSNMEATLKSPPPPPKGSTPITPLDQHDTSSTLCIYAGKPCTTSTTGFSSI